LRNAAIVKCCMNNYLFRNSDFHVWLLKKTPHFRLVIPLIGYSEFYKKSYICIYTRKNTDHQQMHKESFIINRNTLLHVSTVLGHLQGELFVIVTLRLHFIVEWGCAVDCVLRELSAVQACRPAVHRQQHILTQL
jgi:hypothetical protein